jgi:hypothetical protein
VFDYWYSPGATVHVCHQEPCLELLIYHNITCISSYDHLSFFFMKSLSVPVMVSVSSFTAELFSRQYGPVHPAYNPSFSACFFNWNSIFLSQQISQQCFSTGLSAQPNGAYDTRWEPCLLKLQCRRTTVTVTYSSVEKRRLRTTRVTWFFWANLYKQQMGLFLWSLEAIANDSWGYPFHMWQPFINCRNKSISSVFKSLRSTLVRQQLITRNREYLWTLLYIRKVLPYPFFSEEELGKTHNHVLPECC